MTITLGKTITGSLEDFVGDSAGARAKAESDTPRTDAHAKEIGGDDGLVYASFARELERSLSEETRKRQDAETAAIELLKSQAAFMRLSNADHDRLTAYAGQLEEALKEAKSFIETARAAADPLHQGWFTTATWAIDAALGAKKETEKGLPHKDLRTRAEKEVAALSKNTTQEPNNEHGNAGARNTGAGAQLLQEPEAAHEGHSRMVVGQVQGADGRDLCADTGRDERGDPQGERQAPAGATGPAEADVAQPGCVNGVLTPRPMCEACEASDYVTRSVNVLRNLIDATADTLRTHPETKCCTVTLRAVEDAMGLLREFGKAGGNSQGNSA